MLISYNWLKRYFPDETNFPDPKKLEEGIIFHSFEVESTTQQGDDWVLDVKVLPDRAHDCLSHLGVAREVSAIFDLPLVLPEVKKVGGEETNRQLEIKIEDPKLCRRYIGRVLENIEIKESPEWLKSLLEAVGQRSINNVVDATNFVMLDLGQPLHAFDADKVIGNISIRTAKVGEKFTTLDSREVELTTEDLLICDNEGPLAIAGIKGGKRAEVDVNTKNIILESANFDPANVRRTANRIAIRTDAVKRFENDLSCEVANEAMDALTDLLLEIAGTDQTKVGKKIDVYPTPQKIKTIELDLNYVNQRLGIEVPEAEALKILENLDIKVEKSDGKIICQIPHRRVDLEIPENLVEEIGRLYGYDKIGNELIPSVAPKTESLAMKRFRVMNKIRQILIDLGFSEVYGYSLANKGEVELANPLASDKAFLRTNLADFFADRLTFNLQHTLYDKDAVKIFEIGKVFLGEDKAEDEQTHLAIGLGYKSKKLNKSTEMLAEAEKALVEGLKLTDFDGFALDRRVTDTQTILELNLDKITEAAGPPAGGFEPADLAPYFAQPETSFQPIPLYPRIIRDVAVWVPAGTEPIEVQKTIKNSAGELLDFGPDPFDSFEKDNRKSLAFRLVLQSYEKTLTDEEANETMDKIIATLEAKGWEVRK